MKAQPLFMEPVFKEMIWGGTALRDVFGYDIPGDDTGECWAISAHENGDCTVRTRNADGTPAPTDLDGRKLSALYREMPALFWGDAAEGAPARFPILTKILAAADDLSIQVHPDDAYAHEHENGADGKTECWYVIDAKPDATIIIGHNASSKEELKQMMDEKRFKELVREIPVKKGDFFFIEAGTVHAIKAGTLILETQQNTDITYRLYDYDRLQNGKPRELHLEKCLDVIPCPYQPKKVPHAEVRAFSNGSYIRNLVTCGLFGVNLISVTDELKICGKDVRKTFTIVSVLDGEGAITRAADSAETWQIRKGEHMILPADFGAYTLTGNLQIVTSWPE